MARIRIPKANFWLRLRQAVDTCKDGDTLVVPDQKARVEAQLMLTQWRKDVPLVFIEVENENNPH